MPAREHSRTRYLLQGETTEAGAQFWWGYDPASHSDWGQVLDYHRRGIGRKHRVVRDVIGISEAALGRVRRRVMDLWAQYRREETRTPDSPRRDSLRAGGARILQGLASERETVGLLGAVLSPQTTLPAVTLLPKLADAGRFALQTGVSLATVGVQAISDEQPVVVPPSRKPLAGGAVPAVPPARTVRVGPNGKEQVVYGVGDGTRILIGGTPQTSIYTPNLVDSRGASTPGGPLRDEFGRPVNNILMPWTPEGGIVISPRPDGTQPRLYRVPLPAVAGGRVQVKPPDRPSPAPSPARVEIPPPRRKTPEEIRAYEQGFPSAEDARERSRYNAKARPQRKRGSIVDETKKRDVKPDSTLKGVAARRYYRPRGQPLVSVGVGPYDEALDRALPPLLTGEQHDRLDDALEWLAQKAVGTFETISPFLEPIGIAIEIAGGVIAMIVGGPPGVAAGGVVVALGVDDAVALLRTYTTGKRADPLLMQGAEAAAKKAGMNNNDAKTFSQFTHAGFHMAAGGGATHTVNLARASRVTRVYAEVTPKIRAMMEEAGYTSNAFGEMKLKDLMHRATDAALEGKLVPELENVGPLELWLQSGEEAAGAKAGGGGLGYAAEVGVPEQETVKAYRSQGRPLLPVDEAGNISIARPLGRKRLGVVVHIGFDKNKAMMWIQKKGRREIIEFEVDKSFLDRLRQIAEPEHGITHGRTLPWRVDVDYPDQYAIPPAMLDELERAIKPGSGRIITDE